ncbi:hypothetical protein DMENIID0001_113360 [Sergentomyia squamirostris]
MISKVFGLMLLCLLLAIQLNHVMAVKCYQCSSSDNKYCADPPYLDGLDAVDCGSDSVCTKEVLTVFDKTIVSRWCGDANFCRQVDESIGSCSLCLTDRCNSSSFLQSSISSLLLATILAVFARRIFTV